VNLRRNRPLLYKATMGEDSEENPPKSDEESESEDSEDVDMDKPLAINKEVDRLGLKT